MLYININESITIGNSVYSLNYIDCPDFTFIKRISKSELKKDVYYEMGIDFSESTYFYSQKYQEGKEAYDTEMIDLSEAKKQCKELIQEFRELSLIKKIQERMTNEFEKEILERLFKEIEEKVNKKP